MTEEKKSTKPKADWEAIERDYRTTNLSGAELAARHGDVVTRQAISKRAREKGWTRDLTEAVRQATKAKVIQAEVSRRAKGPTAGEELRERVAGSFQATVDAVGMAADIGAAVILRHRDDALQARGVVLDLLGELRAATLRADDLEALLGLVSGDLDEKQLAFARMKFNDLLRLHSRIGSAHKLADAFAKLQTLERKAHGLDGEGDDGKPKSGDDLWGAVHADVESAA